MTARRTTNANPTVTKTARRGSKATPAKTNATPPAAPATEADPLVTMLGFAPAKGTKTAKAKAEAVKQDARRALANHLVSAYAKAFADMADNDPIFVALGREDAAQFASNWVHHLPITAEAFGTNLPLPKRSNWADGNRK